MNKQLLLFCYLESIIQKYISILEVKRCHSGYLSLDFFLSLSLCWVKARIYDEWEEQWVMFTRVCARACVCVWSMKTLLRNYRVWWSCTCTTVYSSQVRWGLSDLNSFSLVLFFSAISRSHDLFARREIIRDVGSRRLQCRPVYVKKVFQWQFQCCYNFCTCSERFISRFIYEMTSFCFLKMICLSRKPVSS